MLSVKVAVALFVVLLGHSSWTSGYSYVHDSNLEELQNDLNFNSGPSVIRAKRFADNFNYTSAYMESKRIKRSIDGNFLGHPKSREERWHAAFNLNRSTLQLEQAQSLVALLNRVMEKYMNACTPIIFYDQYVEESDGIVLQTFFQATEQQQKRSDKYQ